MIINGKYTSEVYARKQSETELIARWGIPEDYQDSTSNIEDNNWVKHWENLTPSDLH